MSRQLLLLVALVLAPAAVAAARCDPTLSPFVDKEFVIVRSTASFDEASRAAAKAAAELNVALDLRGLSPNLRTGLTFSREQCARDEVPYPCYVPRARQDGTYVSIEWSSAYDLLAKGLYVVMVASDTPGSRATRRMLDAARRIFPDAYAKRIRVYVRCEH